MRGEFERLQTQMLKEHGGYGSFFRCCVKDDYVGGKVQYQPLAGHGHSGLEAGQVGGNTEVTEVNPETDGGGARSKRPPKDFVARGLRPLPARSVQSLVLPHMLSSQRRGPRAPGGKVKAEGCLVVS